MPKKMILIWIKYFLENKSSLSHHIMKEKRRKKEYTHPLSPTTPSHTTKKKFLEKQKKLNLVTLRNNQTSPSHATQKTTS